MVGMYGRSGGYSSFFKKLNQGINGIDTTSFSKEEPI